jgi:hypothetical protein
MDYRFLSSLTLTLSLAACGGGPTAAQSPQTPTGTPIGAAGGTVTSSDGRARLVVPAGALSSTMSFTLARASGSPLDPAVVGPSDYQLTPAGVTFASAARLHVVYLPNLRPSGTAESELRVHRLASGAWSVDGLVSAVDAATDTASTDITASGTFAVRWPDPTMPCSLSEDRLFDFWLGEWSFAQTQPVTSSGLNTITRDVAGCRILENFNGGQGRSVSFYSRLDQQWHQTYVDTSGNRVAMAGIFEDGRMRLYSSPGGRWTWQQVDDTTIRYFGESLVGGTWTVTFDSRYTAR